MEYARLFRFIGNILNVDAHDGNSFEHCIEKVLLLEDPLKFVYDELITRRYVFIDPIYCGNKNYI